MAEEIKPTEPIPTEPIATATDHIEPEPTPEPTPAEPTESDTRMAKMEDALTTLTTQLTTLTTALNPAGPAAPVAPIDPNVITEESIRAEFYEDPVKAMDNHSKLRLQPFMDNYAQAENLRTAREIGIAAQSIESLPRAAELKGVIEESVKALNPIHKADPITWLNAYHMQYGKALSAEAGKGGPTTLPISEIALPPGPAAPTPGEASIARKLGVTPEAYTRGKTLPSSDQVINALVAGVT